MPTEIGRTNLSDQSFEDVHARIARMVDSQEYDGVPGVEVGRHVMSRAVRLTDGRAHIGGSPVENIPVITAGVHIGQGKYDTRAYKMDDEVTSDTLVSRADGEYVASIKNPRAAVLVASLANRAIDHLI